MGNPEQDKVEPDEDEPKYPRIVNAPTTIWLQTGSAICDAIGEDELDFYELAKGENLTWCQDEIEHGDLKYILADSVNQFVHFEAAVKALERTLTHLKAAMAGRAHACADEAVVEAESVLAKIKKD